MNKQIFIRNLFEIGAVKRGDFTLKSGKKSDIYVDLRAAALRPYMLRHFAKIYSTMIVEANVEYDSIGCDEGPGPSTILGAMLAHNYDQNINGFVIRKQIKDHGTQKAYEGIIGDKPILIEDVGTTGKSLSEAIAKMPRKPVLALVIVDRGDGAPELLDALGVPFRAALTLQELRAEAPPV